MNSPQREPPTFFTIASAFAQTMFVNRFGRLPLLEEKGLNKSKLDSDSRTMIRDNKWSHFIREPRERINVTMVQEFYSVLSETPGIELTHQVNVRGQMIPWTPLSINMALHTLGLPLQPFMHYEDFWDLDDPAKFDAKCEEATDRFFRTPGILFPTITMSRLSRDGRAWKRFINSRVFPSNNIEVFTEDEILLLLALKTNTYINWGRLIHRVSVDFAMDSLHPFPAMPFASIISHLCLKVYRVTTFFNDVLFPSYVPEVGLLPYQALGNSSDSDVDSSDSDSNDELISEN